MAKKPSIAGVLGQILGQAVAAASQKRRGRSEEESFPAFMEMFGLGGEDGSESLEDEYSREIELPVPKAIVDFDSTIRGIATSLGFLQTLGGACALHAKQIWNCLPEELPETFEELVDGCDVEELLAAFEAARAAVIVVLQQSNGSEELFEEGIADIKRVTSALAALESYSSDSEVETEKLVLTITGTRADLKEFKVRSSEAIQKLELEAIIACAQAYGHSLSQDPECGGLQASAEHQHIHSDLPDVDVAAALAKAVVSQPVQDDVEMSGETSQEPTSSAT